MAEFINQIPGYEKGRVQRITATDEVSESFIVAQMASDLRKKWNTSVLCISLDDHKEAIESLIPQEKAVGTVYVLDQKNPSLKLFFAKPPASSTAASSEPSSSAVQSASPLNTSKITRRKVENG